MLAGSDCTKPCQAGHPKDPLPSVPLVGFAALLVGCVWLMMTGPRPDTPRGVMIQATGQKAIVYVAIVCTLIQSWGAARLHERGLGA